MNRVGECITCQIPISMPEGDEFPVCEDCSTEGVVNYPDMVLRELTKEERNAFQGLEDSYIKVGRKLKKSAPKCHFTPMIYESSESEYGTTDSWWKCTHCGHTKEI